MKLLLRTSLVFIPVLLNVCAVYAQQSVGIGTNTPNPRAVLQLVSPGQNQGFLLPKLTTAQITSLGSSLGAGDIGLQVYDSLLQQIRYWNGTAWLTVSTATSMGTVTSVGLSLPSIFTVSGSPVTTSGTLTGTLVAQGQNTVFAGPTTGTSTPTFRALVAGDIPSLPATIITSGTLPIAIGGTNGTAAPTAGALAYGTGSAYAFTAAGTTGQVLQSNGVGAPTWASPNSFGWGLTGNAGINPATNFLGTTDAQPLRFATGVGGVERMRITPTGNIGIGTTTPATELHVTGNAAVIRIEGVDHAYLEYFNDGPATRTGWIGYGDPAATALNLSNEIGDVAFSSGVGTAFERMRITNTGEVGIGTISPTERLQVAGNIRFSGALMPNNLAGTSGQILTSQGTGVAPVWSNLSALAWSLTGNAGTNPLTNYIGTSDAQPLRINTNGAERMRVSAAGVVGINNTNPVAGSFNPAMRLDVSGAIRTARDGVNGEEGGEFALGEPSLAPGGGTGNWIMDAYFAGGVNKVRLFNTRTGNNHLNITDNGTPFVGIGNFGFAEAALATLDVKGNVRIVDGTQAAGRVLTSDAGGYATWQTLPAVNSWSLSGNTGTVDGTNFLGTTDNIAFTIRTNNIRSARLEPALNGNSFFGFEAGLNVPNASTSTAMGYQALRAATVGSQNTAIGYRAMNVTNNAIQNVAVGMNAMLLNTAGSQNTALGYGAMSANTDGLRNVAVGMSALNANTTGDDNVSVGYQSLLSNSLGNFNVGIGSQALLNTTADNNVAIGIGAGAFNTSGTNNTFLGRSANATVNNLTNATAVGANATVSQSNTIILGNNANVGIGTSTPARRLHVQQTGSSGGLVLEAPSNSAALLDLLTLGNGSSPVNNPATRGWQWIAYGNTFGLLALQNDMALFSYNGTGGTNVMHFDAAGNVGLGTTAPFERLHVGANIFLQNDLNLAEDNDHTIKVANRTTPSANGSNLVLNASNAGSGGLGVSGGSITLQAGDAWNNGGAGSGGAVNIISGGNFNTSDNPGFITMSTRTGTVTTERMRILASGNVGIGTTAPTAQLHTTGGVRFQAFTGPGVLTVDASGNVSSVSGGTVVGSGQINRVAYWNTASTLSSSTQFYWDNANEFLGVGWSAPEHPLHLHRAAGADVLSKYTNTNTFVGAGNGFEVGILAAGDAIFRNMEPTSMQFSTSNIERMRISAAGNVGIGTTTPDASSLVDVVSTLANTIISTNNHIGASNKTGFITTVSGTGTGAKTGLQSIVSGTVGSAAQVLGFSNNINPQGTGTTFGINNTIANLGTGIRYGVFNNISSSATNTSIIYGTFNSLGSGGPGGVIGDYSTISSVATTTGELYGSRYDITPNGTGLVMGSRTTLFAGTGTGQRYGYYSSIGTAAGNASAIYGLHSFINPAGTGTVYSTYNVVQAAGTGPRYGNYALVEAGASNTSPIFGLNNDVIPNGSGNAFGASNIISSFGTGERYGTYNSVSASNLNTSAIYGLHSLTNHSGSGTVYGSYIDANKAAAQPGTVYGQYVISDNDGTGDSYLMFANSIGATTGIEYGLYVIGEDRNYFSNNVGIGTTIPNAPLQFSNALVNRKVVLWEGANNDHQYYGFGVNGATLRYQVDATAANHVFYAGTSATTSEELMRITGTGRVGIGTNAPNSLIDVVGTATDPQTIVNMTSANTWGTALNIGNSTSSTAYQLVTAGSAHPSLPSGSFALSSLSSGNLITVDGSTGDMAIGALSVTTNKIGIGIAPTGSSKVYVRNTDNSFSDGMWLANNRTSAGTVWGLYNTTSNSSTGTLYGIFTSVSGGTAANRWSFYGNDKAFITAGTWGTSDQNLKENISEIKNAISIVQQIPSYSYSYKKDDLYKSFNFPEGIQYGFMAQDLEKVLPTYVNDSEHFVPEDLEKKRKGLISEPRSVRIKSVNYQGIIPILTQAIKEQQEQIELLREQVEELLKKP